MRRLRVRPSQPGLRGPRETLLGPTTWVRPATGWWERMKAGESPRNQGLSVKGAPVRFQKAVSRSKEKRRGEAPIGAPVRVMGRLFPSAEGTGFAVRRPTGAAFRTSACRRFAPSDGDGHSPKAAGRLLPRNDGAWLDERASTNNVSVMPRACGASSNHQRQRLLDRPHSRAMTAEDWNGDGVWRNEPEDSDRLPIRTGIFRFPC